MTTVNPKSKKTFRKLIISSLIFVATALLIPLILHFKNAFSPKENATTSRSPQVICTITYLGDLVKQLTTNSEQISVKTLCQHGVDPHTYIATIKEIQDLKQAQLVYALGLYLEAQMLHFLRKMPHAVLVGEKALNPNDLIAVDASGALSSYDPHVWGDLELWMQITDFVKDDLSSRFSDEADLIERNYERYKNEIQEAHLTIKGMIKDIPAEKRFLLTTHDAFSYFSRAYGIESNSLLGTSTEAEASSKEVIDLSSWVIRNNVTVAFGETSTPNKFIEAVIKAAQSKGHTLRLSDYTLYADSTGPEGSATGSLIGSMMHNAKKISQELSSP